MSYVLLFSKRAARKGDVVEFPGASWQDRLADAIDPEREARAKADALIEQYSQLWLQWNDADNEAADDPAANALTRSAQFDGMARQALALADQWDALLAQANENGWEWVVNRFYELGDDTPRELALECAMSSHAAFMRAVPGVSA